MYIFRRDEMELTIYSSMDCNSSIEIEKTGLKEQSSMITLLRQTREKPQSISCRQKR